VLPYLFIDAGWTLVFPDCALIGQVLLDRGYSVSEERLARAMAHVIHDYDRSLRDGHVGWDTKGFFEQTLERAGVGAHHLSAIAVRLEMLNAERSLWATTYPWVRNALQEMDERGYRMSVISNADGRVAQEFAELGLDVHFEAIFDSHAVGYAKPDVRLFQHAMEKLGLVPKDCLYIGDMYFVDVLGANRASIAGMQVDAYGLYSEWPGVRIPSVACLPEFLTPDLNWQSEAFFPLRDEA